MQATPDLAPQLAPNTVVVLGTGGTMAGTSARAGDNIGYTAAQLGVADLLQSVPGLQAERVLSEQVAQLDSKDLSFDVWRALALRCEAWLARPRAVRHTRPSPGQVCRTFRVSAGGIGTAGRTDSPATAVVSRTWL